MGVTFGFGFFKVSSFLEITKIQFNGNVKQAIYDGFIQGKRDCGMLIMTKLYVIESESNEIIC